MAVSAVFAQVDFSQPSWVNLALQVPLALVIVYLTIKYLDHDLKKTEMFLSHLKEQRQLDRDQLSASLNRLTDEIKNNNTSIIKSSVQEVAQLVERVDNVIEKVNNKERDSRK
jgi:hypothetical protein